MDAWPVPKKPNADEVRVFRDLECVGLMEAKRRISAKHEQVAFIKLRDQGSTAEKVEWLLDRHEERYPK